MTKHHGISEAKRTPNRAAKRRKARKLLGVGTDAKTSKGAPRGYLTGIMYLAPSTESGYQTCPMASKGCAMACLFTAGRGAFDNVRQARISKTLYWFEDRENFKLDLLADVARLVRKAARDGMIPAVRLNGTSDIVWERVFPELFETFPEVQFYDYTKRPGRTTPSNYHLTFSRSEENDAQLISELEAGHNVAMVFDVAKGAPLPEFVTIDGRRFEVIDGDDHDVRFLDPVGVVVGLRGKGAAKSDASGFVLPVLNGSAAIVTPCAA